MNILDGTFNLYLNIALGYFTTTLILISLNQEDPHLQSAAALGISILTILGSAVFCGLNSGLQTRLGHCLGTSNIELLGIYLHKGLIINIILATSATILIYFVPNLLPIIGFEEATVAYITEFINIAVFGIPLFALYEVVVSYLNANKKFRIPSVIQIISTSICALSVYYLIIYLELGITGAAYSYVIQQLVSALLGVLYCLTMNPVPGSLICFRRESFERVLDFTGYMLKTGGQIIIDWAGYEILILFSGTLPAYECTAFLISINIYYIFFSVAVAASYTNSAFVSELMGARNVNASKLYTKFTGGICLAFSVIVDLIYLFFGEKIGSLYSSQQEILSYFQNLIWAYMVLAVLDFVQYPLGGTLKAIKLEGKALVAMFVSVYCLGIPVAIFSVKILGFGGIGIMIGLLTLTLANFIFNVYFLMRNNWRNLAILISDSLSTARDQSCVKA